MADIPNKMKSEKPMSRSTAWKKANRERYNEYQREYMRAKRKKVPTGEAK